MVENLFKFDEIQKLDKPKKPSKRAYLLSACFESCGSIDSSSSLQPLSDPLPARISVVVLRRSITIWVTSCLESCLVATLQ